MAPEAAHLDPRAFEARNTAVLVLQAAMVRVGWIFKTESVLIPAFLDHIAGAAWMRGLLPVLNRIGQSVPPFFLSRRVAVAPLKKRVLVAATFAMAAPFLLLAATLLALGGARPGWLPPVFLTLYVLFFAVTGMHMLATGTLSGKLVAVPRRGRLLALSTVGGTVPAVICAWLLLPGWLDAEGRGYAFIFGFTGACFAASALVALGLREPADDHAEPARPVMDQLRGAVAILRRDVDYRRLVLVNVLFSTSLILLPHYQSLARERLGLEGGNLMTWVVVQNLAVGLGAMLIGPLADRTGNRFALRVALLASAAVPVFALALTRIDPGTGRDLFALVFVGIGWTPIAFRITANYVLELAPPAEHPRYLAIAQLCPTLVMLVSPLFGAGVDVLGYEPVFLGVAVLLLLAALLTFRLADPRGRERRAPRPGARDRPQSP